VRKPTVVVPLLPLIARDCGIRPPPQALLESRDIRFSKATSFFNVDCGQRGPQVAILATSFATIFVAIVGADVKAVFKSVELGGILATSIDGPTLPLAAAAMKSNLVFRKAIQWCRRAAGLFPIRAGLASKQLRPC
jgi:hypothetical protein